jgi:hypothetical protein
MSSLDLAAAVPCAREADVRHAVRHLRLTRPGAQPGAMRPMTPVPFLRTRNAVGASNAMLWLAFTGTRFGMYI